MVCGVFCIYPDMGGEVWCVVCSVYILIWGVRCGVFCIYPDMGGEVWCVVCSVYILIWGVRCGVWYVLYIS